MKRDRSRKLRGFRRSLNLELLEHRRVMAGLTTEFDPRTRVLRIVGSDQADIVAMVQNDATNRLNIQLSSGNQPRREVQFPSAMVQRLVVNLGAGNDQFRYQTTGNVWNRKNIEVGLGSGDDDAKIGWAEDRSRAFASLSLNVQGHEGSDAVGIRVGNVADRFTAEVVADLGDGQDGFVAQVLNPIGARVGLKVEALGGAGNDELQFFGTGRVGPNSRVEVSLNGGTGDDAIEFRHEGGIDGALMQQLEGGEGDDHLESLIDGLAGAGRITSINRGNAGNDTIVTDLRNRLLFPNLVKGTVDGGAGDDLAYVNPSTISTNVETSMPTTRQVAPTPQEPFYPTLPTSIIKSQTRTIEYWTRGVSADALAPVVVLIAGGGASIDSWLSIANRLDRVGQVIAVNKPGYGRTSIMPRSAPSYADAVIADIRNVIASVAPGRQAILVGSSIGGAYAHLLARLYPSEVAGIVFVDGTQPIRVDPTEAAAALVTPVMRVYPEGVQAEYRDIANSVNAPLDAPAFPHVPVIALSQSLSNEELAGAQALADLGTPGRLQIVENAGHFLHADQPKLVADAVQAMVRQTELGGILADVANRYGIPGMTASVIIGNRAFSAAAGVRAAGASNPVLVSDRFGMGSVTKAMTSTLAGILIDRGLIRWDSTIGELFPEFRGQVREEYLSVTLEQLLQHRGGIISDEDANESLQQKVVAYSGPGNRARFDLIPEILKEPLPGRVGDFRYSNGGYAIAGAMMERVTSQTYETLMQRFLFDPLGMGSATFHPPVSNPKNPAQPIGHLADGTPAPGDRSPADYLTNLLSPAGSILRMNVTDWNQFIRIHLGQRVNGRQLLKPSTLARLHQGVPLGEDGAAVGYAAGWQVLQPGEAGLDRRLGGALSHSGSDGVWLSEVTAFPDVDVSIQILANATVDRAGTDLSATAFQELRSRILQRFASR